MIPNQTSSVSVHVSVVTYRRPHLLSRALESLVGQKFQHWTAEVLNDDPEDRRVESVVRAIGDPRIRLREPAQHRGGAGNFNLAFSNVAEPFASILEDDNWWEPDFLKVMLAALEAHPEVEVACGNERIWREEANGDWTDTEITIWPNNSLDRILAFDPITKAGSATICNSSLLFRTRRCAAWRTPDSIPVDVTEHFRERVISHPVLLVSRPLVNYAETLHTHRTRGPGSWGEYQSLLIGSLFALCPADHRATLSAAIWRRARTTGPWAATALLATGWSQEDASELWRQGTLAEKARFALSTFRHPVATRSVFAARKKHASHWQFLLEGEFAEFMRKWVPMQQSSGRD